jgi:hypothetical protein
VLTGEKLNEIGARLEYTPCKSLKVRRRAQDNGLSKSSAATAAKLLQLRPYKATVHALQPRVPVNGTEGQSLQNESLVPKKS